MAKDKAYLEAEQKIAEALQSRATEQPLSRLPLAALGYDVP